MALERFVVARGRVLPEAWEAALLELARRGVEVETEYGEPSLDAPALRAREPGRYAHFADSFHVYQRDYPWFRAFVRQIESGESRRLWRTTAEYERMAGIRAQR